MILSVVVNGHREGRYLTAALRSVKIALDTAGLRGARSEVILILDRPDQDTIAVAEAQQFEEMTIFAVDFGDLGSSRNAGISKARGDYVALLDGDDVWGPQWIRRGLEFAEEHPGSVLHPQMAVTFPNHLYCWQSPDMASGDFQLARLLIENCWTSLAMAPTDIFRRFPYKSTDDHRRFGYEDWAWNGDTIAAGIRHRIVPQTVHFIRKRETSLSMASSNARALTISHALSAERVRQLTVSESPS